MLFMHILICMHLSSNSHKTTTKCFIYYCIWVSQTHTSLHTCWLQTITSNLSGGKDSIRSPCFIFESHLRDSLKVLDCFIQRWQADLKGFASAAAWHRSFCSLGRQRGGCGWVVNIVSLALMQPASFLFCPLCIALIQLLVCVLAECLLFSDK